MKVSVLVHNFNRASVLKKCLYSITTQTYRPLEIVILDAGSNDGSLDVIREFQQTFGRLGIECQVVPCEMMGVAASRNLAAKHASGVLLCFIDNDAALVHTNSFEIITHRFVNQARLAVASFRILSGDTEELDPFAWVFRRSRKKWSKCNFKTFTFAGAGFCIRSEVFWAVGGLWDQLQYSREEEELSITLLDDNWELWYLPEIEVRHYFDARGRLDISERRFMELKNGLLIFYRRFPLPIAFLAAPGRIVSTSLRSLLRDKKIPVWVLDAVRAALTEWTSSHLKRKPVSLRGFLRYAFLQVSRK